jgi:O-antigen/teichoic acid export membrane protein
MYPAAHRCPDRKSRIAAYRPPHSLPGHKRQRLTKQIELANHGLQTTLRLRLRSLISISAGEGIARLSNLVLLVYVSRKLGVRVVGAYALAQGLSLYLMQGIDLGLRHIGARLVASHPAHLCSVVDNIQRKRLVLAIPIIAFGYCYGRFGPVPDDTRSMVSLYSLSIAAYAFSLDWLAWGLHRFAWMSGWRALVSLLGMVITVSSIGFLHSAPTIIALGNGIAYAASAYLLWILWGKRVVGSTRPPRAQPAAEAKVQWRAALWLGAALLVNQAFSSIDILMLGSLSDSTQTGLYSAAYRMLLLVLAIYYLLTQTIYPQLAALPPGQRSIRTLRPYFWKLGLSGAAIAIAMEYSRKILIIGLYGRSFSPAVRLCEPLLLAIPIELIAAFLMTALIAWDHPRKVLCATGAAGAGNVLGNYWAIPRYGAMGASYVTPHSYGVFLIVLIACMRRPLLSTPPPALDGVIPTSSESCPPGAIHA